MAEGDGAIYNNFKEQILLGELDLGNGADQLRLMLVAGYTPNIDTHASYSDVSAQEETGTGYTATGEVLANQAVTQGVGAGATDFDGDDVVWSGLDVGLPSHCILYDDTHASDYLIAYWEITTTSNGGDFTVQWHVDGILTIT